MPDIPEMHVFEVGKLYKSGRTRWPEATEYSFRAGHHQLIMFLGGVSPREVEAVRKGETEFAIVEIESIIFLLYRIGYASAEDRLKAIREGNARGDAFAWSDCSYSWWREPIEYREMPNPEPTDEERATLQIFLVDASTGILKALRFVSFSPAVTAALQGAIRRQATLPTNPYQTDAEYDRVLNGIYAKYRLPMHMMPLALARDKGGK